VLSLFKLLLVVVFLVLGASFAVMNDALVTLDLYFITPDLPLSLILLFAVGAGIVLGAVASMFFFLRIKKENTTLKRQARLVQQEVKNLRAMPINGH
jgi:putative membrane protein